MKFRLLTTAALIALLGSMSACFREDIRTAVYEVPAMGSPECVKIIQNALGSVDGVLSASPNLINRTIAVTYDSGRLGTKNIEYVISGAGFDVDTTPGNSEAKKALPVECQ